MSHPNPSGNGCSLEDCYTNLFALTDICGIKWKKLTAEPDYNAFEHLEDPVLESYSRCIQSQILCVWRRVQRNCDQQRGSFEQPQHHKELWIFWYGDEPSVLCKLLSPTLKEVQHGSWDKDKDTAGLSYECRTLLFKALHNLIERCLVGKGFARLGKWFVQPYDSTLTHADRGTHLSFSFNFFLHGESSVCASIEVKQHPPVWYLTTHHLTLAQENQANFQVILAPYGLNGTLTGNAYRETDQSAHKILEDWGRFYPLDSVDQKDGDFNKPPALVEVVVAGVRMKYPSCFTFLSDSEESPARVQALPGCAGRNSSLITGGPMSPPTSPDNTNLMGGDASLKVLPSLHYSGNPNEINTDLVENTAAAFSIQIRNKLMQDNCVTSGIAKRSTETINEDNATGVWDIHDPTAKSNCNCVRHRANKINKGVTGHVKGAAASGAKHQKGENPEKLERQQSRANRTLTSFHRRSHTTDDLLQFDMGTMMPQTSVPVSSANSNFNATGNATVLPQLNNSGEGAGVESPSPAAPSPLDEPHSQATVNQSVDPTMPKLSPHPPADDSAEKEGSSGAGNKPASDPQCTISNGPTDAVAKTAESANMQQKAASESVFSPSTAWPAGTNHPVEVKSTNINGWIASQQRQIDSQNLKRPVLPSKDCEPDELVTNSLYSFDQVRFWNDFPVKKARIENIPQLAGSLDVRQPNSNMPSPAAAQKAHKPSTPQPSAPDIYEFSDEASINPSAISTRPFRTSRDERTAFSKMEEDLKDPRHGSESYNFQDRNHDSISSVSSPPATPNTQPPTSSLTNVYDLVPKTTDLDHIFESDSDNDNDDAFTSPTTTIASEEKKTTASIGSAIISEGSIAACELARMYPTPPSNPESFHDSSMDFSCAETKPVIKQEAYPCHPHIEEMSKDCPFVFKQQEVAQFDLSVKYSPIELPSANLTLSQQPAEYKASWQFPMPIMDKPHPSSYINSPSIENIPSLTSRMPSSAVEASPAFQNSVGQQRTPMSYELQSPASNASSYLNKTLNSIDNAGTNHQMPEVHSLIVNIVLSDSRLNLFRDHNFDSCNICVCNMNIKGVDVGLYMPDPSGNSAEAEQQQNCMCGFSALVNRKVGHNAGLFYEDEVDITGIRNDRYDQRKPSLLLPEFQHKDAENKSIEEVNQSIMELLLGQFTMPYPALCASEHLQKLWLSNSSHHVGTTYDVLQLQDGNEVSYQALDQGRQAMEHCSPNKLEDSHMRSMCLHKWQFLQGANRIPLNSQDSLRLLKALQPILQDAIQHSRFTRLWEHTYKLSGPLTWKEFHQLAGRGSDESSAPQPVPSFLVGHDRDWLSVSPYALHYWDKQFLEPYGKARDIAYVVVAPESDYILSAVKLFFKELSTIYEMCRLGRHCPISKVLRDGIMRVGKKAAEKLSSESIGDEWFSQIGDQPIAEKLRLYAKVCSHQLSPYLCQQNLDKSLFEPQTNHRPGYKAPDSSNLSSTSSSSMSSSSSSSGSSQTLTGSSDHSTFNVPSSQSNSTEEKGENSQSEGHKDQSGQEADHDDTGNCPALVVYLVNPFTYGQDWNSLDRLVMLGLLKCYQQLVKNLPEHLQNNVYLQIVPLKAILDNIEHGSNSQLLKSMSFSVFTACRWNLAHTIMGRSLTGFGPAAAAERFLRKKEGDKTYKLHSPPFILAPTKDKQSQLTESCGEKIEKSNIIYCVYCLSEDQRWLLGVCTDESGELIETCTINIEIPNRNRRRKASARKIGLQKFWDFVLSVVSLLTVPCRLVISRFGRIGHGEMKGWSGLLSKKNILAASKHMREICHQCSYLGSGPDVPGIISACLISLESQPTFHIMDDSVKQEEKMSSNCPLQTPRDVSTTHILVFPTSATVQANSQPVQFESSLGGIELETNDFGDVFNTLEEDLNNDQDPSLLSIFAQMTGTSVIDPACLSGGNISNPGSPTGLLDPGRHSSSNMNGHSVIGEHSNVAGDPQDEPPNLLQQPLAMAYFLSTAKTGPLPKWFWATAPENESRSPNCFKASLHINSSINHQDEWFATEREKKSNPHPLDSSLTCDVLRYVLENFNSLSWLSYDTVKNDRESCLPIHFVVLLQMYHALNAFV